MAGEKSEQITHDEIALSHPGGIGEERLDSHIRDDHNDPHRAALEDIDLNQNVTKSTWAAVFFLGFTFQPSLFFTILMVFPILVPIAIELQGSTHNVNWMASGWSLAGSIAFAIAGQTSDYFGRRYILLFGQALLVLGHIIGCTANSVNQGIAAMVILGFGTGTTFVMYPGISELLPNEYRSIGLAWTELNVLPFSTFGPLFARLLLTNVSWRWVFYLGIITGVISFVGTAIFYIPPAKPLADRTRMEVLRELDYIGIFLYTAGLTLFLLGLGWGGVSYPWRSAARSCKTASIPKGLLGNVREYTILLVLIFVTGFVYFSLTDLIPEQIGYMFTSKSLTAGLYNIPGGFGGAGGGVILGALIARLKHVQWQLFVGIACQTLFTALFALITPDTIPMALVFQCLANLPFAWITLACYVTASLHVPQRDLGLALGLIGTFRFLGGAIGTTVFTIILNNKSAVSIPRRVAAALAPLNYPPSQYDALVTAIGAGTTDTLTDTPTNVIAAAPRAIQWGYSDAFRITWLASIPFGVIACTLAIFVRDPSPYITKHTSVTLEKERLGGRTTIANLGKGDLEGSSIRRLEGGGEVTRGVVVVFASRRMLGFF